MKKKNLWGLFLIFSALYLIADIAGWLTNMPGLFTSVAAILLACVSLTSIPKLDFYGMIMPLSFIAMLFSKELKIEDNTWTIVFAAFLLSSGLSVLFKKYRKKNKKQYQYHKEFNNGATFEFTTDDDGEEEWEPHETKHSTEDRIRTSVSFSSKTRYVRSNNFTFANLECDFGQLDVYFNDAIFNPNGSEIVVDCNFGNINLYLPKNISVENQVDVTLGSNGEDGLDHIVEGAPLVRIRGDVSLGALNIYYL